MKQFLLILTISFLFLACKKIPSKTFIELDFISINGDTSLVNGGLEFDYDQIYALELHYDSDHELDEIYIQLQKNFKGIVDGIDESRVSPIPAKDDKKGKFIYTLNPKEQCDPPSTGELSVFEFIKLVFINKVGTVEELTIQFKII